jgi:hypothetical protein
VIDREGLNKAGGPGKRSVFLWENKVAGPTNDILPGAPLIPSFGMSGGQQGVRRIILRLPHIRNPRMRGAPPETIP